MSQNSVVFNDDPSGVQLLDNKLTPLHQNLLTQHSGTSRPSYAVAGTEWLDTTTTPWKLKRFDGTDDIITGYVNATSNTYTPAGILLDNIAATTNPTVNEDSADGYSVGSVWVNVTLDQSYMCQDSTVGAAVWKLITLTLADVQAGLTMTGKLNTVATATGAAGLNVPHGTAPTSPTNGDFWSTTAAFFARINGVTQTLLTLAAGTLTGKLTTVASATGAAGFNLPHGTAPTSPADGDLWTTTTGLNARINGATVALGAGSDYVKLSTQTASSSGSIDFTAALDSTYKKYVIECIDIQPSAASAFGARINTGGGYISTATYKAAGIGRAHESTGFTIESASQNYVDLTGTLQIDAGSGIGNYFRVEVINPSHSSKITRIPFFCTFKQTGVDREYSGSANGLNTTTSAITGIQFLMLSGNITSGTFILYGVK